MVAEDEEAVNFLHIAGGRCCRGGHHGGPRRQDGGLLGDWMLGPQIYDGPLTAVERQTLIISERKIITLNF